MEPLHILVACEMSGAVWKAFTELGHDCWSCDLMQSEQSTKHYQGDVRDLLCDHWDMMIAFPPCTHLAVSGSRWFGNKVVEQAEALDFVRLLWNAPIERIAIENPVGVISTHIHAAHQVVQPWQFGHGETKATCFWLKNLPKLKPTNIVDGREQRIWRLPPSPTRAIERSRTFEGIATAMAQQWGTDEGLTADLPLFAQEVRS